MVYEYEKFYEDDKIDIMGLWGREDAQWSTKREHPPLTTAGAQLSKEVNDSSYVELLAKKN